MVWAACKSVISYTKIIIKSQGFALSFFQLFLLFSVIIYNYSA
jgi:hypothetical protein